MSEITFDEIKPVWVAWTNTDLTEGRGWQYPLCVADGLETAYRLGRKNYVMGSDCPVTAAQAYRMGGTWYVPGRVVAESAEDLAHRKLREAREQAIERAKAVGLSQSDIELLSKR